MYREQANGEHAATSSEPNRVRMGICLVLLAFSLPAEAEFYVQDDGRGLAVFENSRPVLVYNYETLEPPGGVDGDRWRRSCYIHPLYGPHGEILTEDFPPGHYGHRGLFWAWPECRAGGRLMNLWTLEGAHPVFERWTQYSVDEERVVIGVENAWIDDESGRAYVLEGVTLIIWPSKARGRAVDFHLKCTNVSDGPVQVSGHREEGYGGLTFRASRSRMPYTFVTAQGVFKGEAPLADTPWAGLSFRVPRSSRYSGVAIFQHPGNPGHPNAGWIMRDYGLLGASWPRAEALELDPGETFELRYRLYIHAGRGDNAGLASIYANYVKNQDAGKVE